MKTKKKLILNCIFFIILFFITYYLIFRNQDMSSLLNNLKSVNPIFLIISFVCMILFYLFEAINVNRLLKAFGEKYPIIKSFNSTLIGAFYSSITPAASGGEPMQIYYISKDNIKISHSTLAFLIHLFSHLIAIVLFGIISLIFNYKIINSKLLLLFIVGLTFNAIILVFYSISIFSEKLTNKLIKFVEKVLKFFKIKNVDKINKKIDDELKVFNESSVFIKKNKKIFIKSIMIAFLQVFINYSIPYFIYRSFGLNEYNILYIVSLQAILFCTVSFLPLPGTVGINETVFLVLYSNIYNDSTITNALLLQRGITFYLFVIISLIVVIVNNIRLTKKGLKD